MFEHPATDFARVNFSSERIGSESMQFGVPHDASHATLPNSAFNGTLSHWLPSLWSLVVVVGQLDRFALVPSGQLSPPNRTTSPRHMS